MGKKSVTRYILGAMLALFLPIMGHAQGGQLGSYSSPVVNGLGRPLPGINVAICQPLATTGAAVTSNVAILTMASNPITAGFVAGMTIQVAGFTGGDTYFNGGTYTGTTITSGYTILSVTSTTITYSLVHVNASAGTNGTVLQIGNSSTSCAGKSTVYSNPSLTTTATNPAVSDGNGNWNVFAAPGLYYVQFYGTGITATLKQIAIACVPNSGGTSGCTVLTNQLNNFTVLQEFSAGISPNGTNTLTLPAKTDTLAVQTNTVLDGTPTGTGIQTKVQKMGTGSGNYVTPADTNYHDVDASDCSFTNHTGLCATLTIPTGWVLTVNAVATVTTATAAATVGIAILDTANVIETQIFPTTLGQGIEAVLTWNIVGDGASHTIKLEYKTFTGADSAIVLNSTVTFKPVMNFTLAPSN